MTRRNNSMLLRATIAGLALAAGLGSSMQPARAQFWTWREPAPVTGGWLPPAEVSRRALSRGYRLETALQRSGEVLIADATDRRGRRMRVVINPLNGRVIQTFPFEPPRPRASVPGFANNEPLIEAPSRPERRGFFLFGEPEQPVVEPPKPVRKPPKTRAVAAKAPVEKTDVPPPDAGARPAVATQPAPTAAPAQPVTTAAVPPATQPSPAPYPVPQVIVGDPPARPVNRPAPPPAIAAVAPVSPVATPAPAPPRETSPQAAAPARPPDRKTGFANGVPINPLD